MSVVLQTTDTLLSFFWGALTGVALTVGVLLLIRALFPED